MTQTREVATQGMVVTAPMTLGFADCMALLLSAILMAIAVLWPHRRRA